MEAGFGKWGGGVGFRIQGLRKAGFRADAFFGGKNRGQKQKTKVTKQSKKNPANNSTP